MNGTTATTIPIRDANGRMQAADPASGATDKTLVTANWVSQTGSGRPNNLIHDGGSEIIRGNKIIYDRRDRDVNIASVPASYSYYTVDRIRFRGALSGDVAQTFLNKLDGSSTGSNGNGAGIDLYAKDANDVQYAARLVLYINPDTKTAKLFIRVSGGGGSPVTTEIGSVSMP